MPSIARTPIEIRIEILQIIHDGVSVASRIDFQASINNGHIRKELEYLLQQEYITCVEDPSSKRRNYHMTEKGVLLLDYLKEANNLIDI